MLGITMNIEQSAITDVLKRTESYLTESLLPFWIERSVDRERGGFLTYFDRDGKATGQTTKTFLMQIRMLFTMANAHRHGYGGGACAELAAHGARFIREHYWDDAHGGWHWIADVDGKPTCVDKVGYGQSFGVYAFATHAIATGDDASGAEALRTWAAICANMIDTRHGGYYEIMLPDWSPAPAGKRGGDRKSFDVHMHMMEAMTALYEMTGDASHRRRLLEVIDLLVTRMLMPEHGVAYSQFALDYTPLRAIRFDVEWGSDEEPPGGSIPLDVTSYGHNVEFAWLLRRADEVLGQPDAHADVITRICDHCIAFGIDPEFGGVYIEGPAASAPPPDARRKQFWQQAEVMVGLIFAYEMTGDAKYWHAFTNVYEFVFRHFVNMPAGGEWYALVDRDGTVLWDYLGHEWKISYHTVRAIIEIVAALKRIVAGNDQ
ncbi:MAG: N-acylglucosamine 2-epimerase [Phycisphaera sp.]|nr:N-acylglucosamine 2-epimerase [Phycisphaera sp.]